MQQTNDYLDRFRQAANAEERQTVVDAYQVYYQTLPNEERIQADKVMGVLWPSIEQKVAELAPLMDRLEALMQKASPHRVQTIVPATP